MIHIIKTAWIPDYADPATMITTLFTNEKPNDNIGQVNDSQLQQWIYDTMAEFNETAREELYYNIQKFLIEEIYPALWLHSTIFYEVYLSNVKGLSHPGNGLYFKGVYFS
jgi:ABC-type transport system substrate-binding protein